MRAINVDGVTGTLEAEKNTRREALELARSLRKEGFLVMITGPDGNGRGHRVAGARRPRCHSHRTIIVRPFSVIASLTTPTDRPATSIPGIAVAYPRRINAPSKPMVKPLAFISASEQPGSRPAFPAR
jgi:hypothetical protein